MPHSQLISVSKMGRWCKEQSISITLPNGFGDKCACILLCLGKNCHTTSYCLPIHQTLQPSKHTVLPYNYNYDPCPLCAFVVVCLCTQSSHTDYWYSQRVVGINLHLEYNTINLITPHPSVRSKTRFPKYCPCMLTRANFATMDQL